MKRLVIQSLFFRVLKFSIQYNLFSLFNDKFPSFWPSFSGCISADDHGNRLFLSDTNHHRIIVTDGDGQILDCVCVQ